MCGYSLLLGFFTRRSCGAAAVWVGSRSNEAVGVSVLRDSSSQASATARSSCSSAGLSTPGTVR